MIMIIIMIMMIITLLLLLLTIIILIIRIIMIMIMMIMIIPITIKHNNASCTHNTSYNSKRRAGNSSATVKRPPSKRGPERPRASNRPRRIYYTILSYTTLYYYILYYIMYVCVYIYIYIHINRCSCRVRAPWPLLSGDGPARLAAFLTIITCR